MLLVLSNGSVDDSFASQSEPKLTQDTRGKTTLQNLATPSSTDNVPVGQITKHRSQQQQKCETTDVVRPRDKKTNIL